MDDHKEKTITDSQSAPIRKIEKTYPDHIFICDYFVRCDLKLAFS